VIATTGRPRTGRRVSHPTRHKLVDTLRAQAAAAPTRAPLIAAVSGFLGELAPETYSAVRWVADEASAQDVELHMVSVVEWRSIPSWSRHADNIIVRELQRSADAAVEAALDVVEDEYPSLTVHGEVLRGDRLAVLRLLGLGAGTIALGTRRLPFAGEVLLGSLSAALSACAPCPVVVVSDRAPEPGQVVVGIDDGNAAAVRFAADFAQRHALDLHVVYAHAPLLADVTVFRRDAERWVAEELAGVLADYPDLPIRSTVHLRRTVETLVEQSRGQRLLVVGRRHRTRYPALQVGSVSQGVLHHAQCPVAVVPT
jgi:nucleotide-binding universal stress UspA family protein